LLGARKSHGDKELLFVAHREKLLSLFFFKNSILVNIYVDIG
jgi:hypothetical protein